MRKLLLFVCIAGFGMSVLAQQRAVPSREIRNLMVKKTQLVKGGESYSTSGIPGGSLKSILEEEAIGSTWYDVQTNQSMQTRIYLHSDGTMGAVWTYGPEGNPSGNDRGTGYNYFDGNSWGDPPTAAIETGAKAGWPSYTTFGENGEAYTCHDYWDGTILGTRTERGTGTWNLVIQGGPPGVEDISFPRVTTTGVDRNLIHILSTTWGPYNGQTHALLYARTNDAGATWEVENQLFDELGTDYTLDLGGDTYDWAEPRAGVLAFLVGDGWMDLVIMKSTDEGETWEKSVIWECPFPLNAGTPTDTFYSPDGSHDITIDYNGLIHVAFSLTRSLDDGAGASYFPGVDGVVYWNENRPSFSNDINALCPYPDCAYTELEEDYSLVGWSQDLNQNGTLDILNEWGFYNTGMSSQPQIIVDEQNRVFVLYSSVTEGFNNGASNYRHIWVRSSPNGGEWWGDFHDMNSALANLFDECVFLSASDNSDDNIYYTYQADATSGTVTNSTEENFTRFVQVSKTDIISGIQESQNVLSSSSVSHNYPNPFNGTATVYVILDQSASLSLEVCNLMGRVVYRVPEQRFSSGKVELVIDAKNLEPGVYFYTVRSGIQAVTRKMIVE